MTCQNGSTNGQQVSFDLDVLVIGAGFGGVYALYKIRKLGLNTRLFEAGNSLGGVWHWNRYPGARVDSEIPYYQFSIPEVWKTWNWSCRFPDHSELRAYFDHVDKILDIKKDVVFEANVVGASFDIRQSKWHVVVGDGRNATCKYLITATGSSYKKYYPDFQGLKDYAGHLVHSANWPEADIDVADKKVAIVGAGATGVQLVEQLSKRSKDITVFIRTPNIALPMVQRQMSPEEQNSYKSVYNTLFKACRASASGLPYTPISSPTLSVPPEELEALYEELYHRGSFNLKGGNHSDFLSDLRANCKIYDFWLKKTRSRISDPVKRDILAPLEQPYAFATKRSSLEQDYYECIDKSHVKVVDLKKSAIKEFRETGIMTEDGILRNFDLIVLATGYDSVTGSMTGMGLVDKNGVDMKEKWRDGVFTHLGMMCSGFPNMFMVYGPQAPTALANGTTIVEAQGDWICDAIRKLEEEDIATIEAERSAEEKWKQDIDFINAKTLFPTTKSWYMGDNIPGKKREQLNYLAGIPEYEKACRDALDGWKGFKLTRNARENVAEG